MHAELVEDAVAVRPISGAEVALAAEGGGLDAQAVKSERSIRIR